MSKINFLFLLYLKTIIVLMCNVALNSLYAEEWRIWIADGKSDYVDVDFKPGSDLCKSYFGLLQQAGTSNLKDVNDDGTTSINHAAFTCEELKQTKIGSWGHYTVYDLTNATTHHKGIILEDEHKKYWLLYAQFGWSIAEVDQLPQIKTIAEQTVLTYHGKIHGSGSGQLAYYFVLNKTNGRPELIDTSAIETAITKAIPPKWSINKGGGLNLEKLTFNHCIWKPDDCQAQPTGGSITLNLTLEGNAIRVLKTDYRPDDIWSAYPKGKENNTE